MDSNISKKDQIILQQLEVIRTMTENNVKRMTSDFWPTPSAAKKETPAEETPKTTSSTGNSEMPPAEKEEVPTGTSSFLCDWERT